LEDKQQKWRIVLSSHSFAGTIAAVKAGMGLTVLPRNMIPDGLPILSKADAPAHLEDTHISLLKHSADNIAVNSFENFVIERLN
jgi:DNA-binding transcriptional LysR family regulator